jgi:hypothetical protein
MGSSGAVRTEKFGATATPVSIVREPNLDRELANALENICYASS